MFKIILTPKAGFCFGVKRAMKIAEETARSNSGLPSYTFGPLIHNPQAVAYLESIGVHQINRLEGVKPGKLIVRSHGMPPSIVNKARKLGFEIIDATCPIVRRSQDFAKFLLKENYTVVVIGEANHPEVIGIVGHTNGKAIVVEKESDVKKIEGKEKIGVVTQTTQSMEYFQRLVLKILELGSEIRIYNTICGATQQRQKSTLKLAERADVMIIIGGKNSANTTHLAQLSRETGKPTYHIERAEEILPEWFENKHVVGVSAGASTPSYVIEEVITQLQYIRNKVSDPNGSRLLI
ncbi:MAG: 4-hydroxy-3-methylbut-2-enyl diphosphate reductase [Candidatus Cloacimonas sp. 4484_209]|nr:MAG: 4-hydroxy-3-methylbut-2-enyl diphosphate reductase [Candidatus Cloacimonas sp. 4484_209]